MGDCTAPTVHRARMTMARASRWYLGCAVLLLACGPVAAAELFRWVDEHGVTNYSNNPPAKPPPGTRVTVVEDRTSVYTPERAVTEALQKRAQQKPASPPQNASLTREPEARAKGSPGASATREPDPRQKSATAQDPCLIPGDPNCRAAIYDASPVFQGRRVAPHVIQPQLPPGTTAGNVTGSTGYIAGQSGSAPPLATRQVIEPQLPVGATAGNVTGQTGYIAGQSASAPPPQPPGAARPPAASFTLKPQPQDRERR